MSHNSGGLTNLGEKCFKFGVSPPYDDKGGVGGLNCIPCLVKPLVMVIFIIPGSCSLSVVNLNFNLGLPFKI